MDFEYERILPGISSQLLINLHENELRHWEKPGQLRRAIGPLGVQGILTEPILIDTEQKQNLCGVVFTSFGLSAFCETDAIRFTDTIVDASELWGSAAIKLRNRLLKETDQAQMCRTVEQFLVDRLLARPGSCDILLEILSLLKQGVNVGEVRSRTGLSQRRIHALFDEHIGVRPKTFERIYRFNSVLIALPKSEPLTDLAISHGYSDQAHLTRDFRRFSGNSPTKHRTVPNENRHAKFSADNLFKTPKED